MEKLQSYSHIFFSAYDADKYYKMVCSYVHGSSLVPYGYKYDVIHDIVVHLMSLDKVLNSSLIRTISFRFMKKWAYQRRQYYRQTEYQVKDWEEEAFWDYDDWTAIDTDIDVERLKKIPEIRELWEMLSAGIAEYAKQKGISRQAVNQKKQRLLKKLHEEYDIQID